MYILRIVLYLLNRVFFSCNSQFNSIILVDKRLDEWISLDRFDMNKGELPKLSKIDLEITSDMTERKITRNQKRKNELTSSV